MPRGLRPRGIPVCGVVLERSGGAVEAQDVVQRVVDRVVRFEVALGDPAEPGLLQGPPRRDVGRHHRDEDRWGVREARPRTARPSRAIIAAAQPLAVCRGVAHEVVEREGAVRHLDQRGEVTQVLVVVGDPRPLDQADRPPADEGQPVLVRAPRRRRTARSHARPPRASTRGSTTGRPAGSASQRASSGKSARVSAPEPHGIRRSRWPAPLGGQAPMVAVSMTKR